MKKIFLTLIFLIGLFVSCGKSDIQQINQQYVDVSFSYTLEQGSMYTKSDVFSDVFYTKIVSGELVADTYNIKLTEVNTNEEYDFSGKWNSKDFFTIKTGKYKLTGKCSAQGEYIQNLASLYFDTIIEININDNNVILPAKYDCFLLIFNKDNISKVTDNYSGWDDANINFKTFYTLDNYIYAFSSKLYKEDTEGRQPFVKIYLNSGTTSKIYTKSIQFELGKYYTYNSIDNNFSIPEMTQGII